MESPSEYEIEPPGSISHGVSMLCIIIAISTPIYVVDNYMHATNVNENFIGFNQLAMA